MMQIHYRKDGGQTYSTRENTFHLLYHFLCLPPNCRLSPLFLVDCGCRHGLLIIIIGIMVYIHLDRPCPSLRGHSYSMDKPRDSLIVRISVSTKRPTTRGISFSCEAASCRRYPALSLISIPITILCYGRERLRTECYCCCSNHADFQKGILNPVSRYTMMTQGPL